MKKNEDLNTAQKYFILQKCMFVYVNNIYVLLCFARARTHTQWNIQHAASLSHLAGICAPIRAPSTKHVFSDLILVVRSCLADRLWDEVDICLFQVLRVTPGHCKHGFLAWNSRWKILRELWWLCATHPLPRTRTLRCCTEIHLEGGCGEEGGTPRGRTLTLQRISLACLWSSAALDFKGETQRWVPRQPTVI